MKDVAHVAGKEWLGAFPAKGPAFYVGAEDSKDELHIRLSDITKHYSVTFKELSALHILCLLGTDATLCRVGKSVPRDNQGETAASIRMRMRRVWTAVVRA
jgi:RecA-family ATPase